jgi:bifunctional DNase/RNase
MEKIQLEILGLSYSQTQSGAYALILKESAGKRRLPIIIGGFEAQAIAIEMENMTPSRPLTHDLFKNFSDEFNIEMQEVIVYNLVEGIFFAKLICKDGLGVEREIDARTSDAVALAVRFSCPISTYEFILSSAGIILDDEMSAEVEGGTDFDLEEIAPVVATDEQKSLDDLNAELEDAISREDYERASKLRDEINKRSKSN